MSFWTIEKIESVLQVKARLCPRHDANTELHSITTDSRTLTPNPDTSLAFVAIQGDTHDGHQFIAQAAKSGAAVIIAEKSKVSAELQKSVNETTSLFLVDSSLDAIRALAHFYRTHFTTPFIAVVGSVGKTTTKELIFSLLHGKYNSVYKTEGSQNGFLGIPITLLGMPKNTEIAVIEIGIDDIGAMEKHMELVSPTHVILTALGPEHLHQLKTVEIAAREELKAFDYALQHLLPIALNLSEEKVRNWIRDHSLTYLEKKSYSLKEKYNPDFLGAYSSSNNTLTIEYTDAPRLSLDSLEKTSPHLRQLINQETPKKSLALTLPLPGEHHAHNLLAAFTVTQFFDLTPEEVIKGLGTFKTAYGRTELLQLKNGTQVIGDYYNSNPTSAHAALKLLKERTSSTGKSHAVLADMLELGKDEEQFHRDLAYHILQENIQYVWLYGNRMKWLEDELKRLSVNLPVDPSPQLNVRHFADHASLSAELKKLLKPKDTVLIKGSRGMKMETVLKALQA